MTKKIITKIFIISISLLLVACNKTVFEEKFDDNKNGWTVKDRYLLTREVGNGEYIYYTARKGSCYEDMIELAELPLSFTVEYRSKIIEGDSTSSTSFSIGQDRSNYFNFLVNPRQQTGMNLFKEGKYSVDVEYKDAPFKLNEYNDFKIVFTHNGKHREYEYYLNDSLMKKGSAYKMPFKYLGIRNCGEITSAYDFIKVTDDQNQVIFEDNFDDNKNGWDNKKYQIIANKIENGMLEINSLYNQNYHFKNKNLEFPENFSFEINTIYLGGNPDFGFYLTSKDRNDSFQFLIMNKNKARTVHFHENKDSGRDKAESLAQGKLTENQKITQYLEYKDGKFTHKVNGVIVDEYEVGDLEFNKFGLVIAGKGDLKIDDITIKKL